MAPLSNKEFTRTLADTAGWTQDQLKMYLFEVEQEMTESQALMSQAAKALAKLRARRQALVSRIDSAYFSKSA